MTLRQRIATKRHSAQCPLCREPIAQTNDPVHECPGCRTVYHRACTTEMGGCSTLGCPQSSKRGRARWRCTQCTQPMEALLANGRCSCGATLHVSCRRAHRRRCARRRRRILHLYSMLGQVGLLVSILLTLSAAVGGAVGFVLAMPQETAPELLGLGVGVSAVMGAVLAGALCWLLAKLGRSVRTALLQEGDVSMIEPSGD